MSLNTVSIPIASGGKNKFDLSCDHQTSMNFLLAQPIYYRHIPRGEHWSDDVLGVIRPVSMYLPTFGRVRNNLRAFFVPYRLLKPQYDAGRGDVLGHSMEGSEIPVGNPQVSNATFIDYFLHTSIVQEGPLVSIVGNVGDNPIPFHHFVYGSQYYVYTASGLRRLKLLLSLGYDVIWTTDKDDFFFDAFGLLAYARIYLDWYANSQYLDSSDVVSLRQILSFNDPTDILVINTNYLDTLLKLVFAVVYDTDQYFNAAWDLPVAPTVGQHSNLSIPDVTVSDVTLQTKLNVSSTENTPVMIQPTNSSVSLGSQYIHDMLQAVTNYQRRHALSGAREIDRALADYGFVPDYMRLNRSVYIGNRSIDLQIGDVMSHAGTSENVLGSFAGRGFGAGKGTFEFTASEDGVIIIVSTIIPSCGIVQGYDRNNRHLSSFDQFDPNFEVGVQVLEKGEVYISHDESFHNKATDYANRFGYTGRFGEYKVGRSWYTDQDRFTDENGDAWNLFRLFTDDNFGGSLTNVVHSLNFTRALDWERFNRIFNYTESDRDKFKCFYHHEVHSMSPMKPLFETYDFKEDHKRIKMDINGSKLN